MSKRRNPNPKIEKQEQQAWTEYYRSIKKVLEHSPSTKKTVNKFASSMMALVHDLTNMPHEEIFKEVEETIDYAKRNPTGFTFEEVE